MNYTCSQIALFTGITGPNFTISNGTCSGSQAIAVASIHLQSKLVDYSVVTSVELSNDFTRKILKSSKVALPVSEELAISLKLGFDKESSVGQQPLSKILSIVTGQLRQNETLESALLTALQKMIESIANQTFQLCLISSGSQHLQKNILEEQMLLQLRTLLLVYLEDEFGLFENSGCLMGIAYATSIKKKNSIICSVDKYGFFAILAIEVI
jgi:hypothetical protein